MRLTLGSRVRPAPDTLFRNLEGEAVLLSLSACEYFGLDEVGTRIWELLPQHESLAGVLTSVLTEFEVGAGQAEEDLLSLVAALRDKGLVQVVDR